VAYVEQKERNTGSGMSPTPSYKKDDENKMKEDDRCPWKDIPHMFLPISMWK
jgi:hypothetical protein